MLTHHQRFGRRNYLLYLVEGGAFIGSVGFINSQTLLPSLILDQGGPEWLAALAPSLIVIGLFAAPIFTYSYVEKLRHYKPFVCLFSLLQRVVYMVAAALLFLLTDHPLAIVSIVALTPFLFGIMGGISLAAWQQLYMGSVETRRRASNMALRYLIGGLISVFAGKVIEWTLDQYPGAAGYGFLHVYAAVLGAFAVLALLFVRENPEFEPEVTDRSTGPASIGENLKKFAILLRDPGIRSFWWVLILMHGMLLITPFYAVGLRARFDQPASFLGILVFWQMIGYSLGNLSIGVFGDHLGGRRTFLLGVLGFAISLLPGVMINQLFVAKLAYLAFGFFMTVTIIGKDALMMEIAPVKNRSFYLSAVFMVSMVCMLVLSLGSYLIWTRTHNLQLLAYPNIILYLVAFFILLRMKPTARE